MTSKTYLKQYNFLKKEIEDSILNFLNEDESFELKPTIIVREIDDDNEVIVEITRKNNVLVFLTTFQHEETEQSIEYFTIEQLCEVLSQIEKKYDSPSVEQPEVVEIVVILIDGIVDDVIPCKTWESALKTYIEKCKEAKIEYDFDSVKTDEDIDRMIEFISEHYDQSKWEIKWFTDAELV